MQKLPLGQRVSKEEKEQRTGSEAQNNINKSRENNVSPAIDIAEKSLIKAVMRTVMTMGKDTEQGRIYEGIAYRLQLFIKERMQLLSVHRKKSSPPLYCY